MTLRTKPHSAVTSSVPATEQGAPLLSRQEGSRAANLTFIIDLAAAVVCLVFATFVPVPDAVIGVLVIAATIFLMLAGIPVAVAIMLASALGMWNLAGVAAVESTFEDMPFHTAESWSLSVIPLFIFMGVAMGKFNLTTRLFDAAQQWLGKLPGGLAVATNFAGAGLAAASGSSIAISYALGRVSIPEMLRAKYQPSLATGVVAMSGTLGMLIPPSVVLVVYAGAAGTPIGPQLLAALVPGILMAIGFALMIMIRVWLKPSLAPPLEAAAITWRTRLSTLPGVIPMTVIVAIIIGGMYSGVFTPTEAGAFGAIFAVLLGWLFNKDRSLRTLWRNIVLSLRDTVAGVASIFFLLIGVHVLTRVVALSGLADIMATAVSNLGLSRVSFLIVLIVVFIILGMFMDGLAMILLTVPVLMPVLASLEINMIWYGVFMVILVEIALVTPPSACSVISCTE